MTVKSEGSEIVNAIKGDGFDLIEILDQFIQTNKQGNKTKIMTSITGNEINQDYISIGSYPFNDIILNKHFPIGLNTVILSTGDKLRITDYSNLNIPQTRTAIVAGVDKLNNLIQGDLVNFAGVPTY